MDCAANSSEYASTGTGQPRRSTGPMYGLGVNRAAFMRALPAGAANVVRRDFNDWRFDANFELLAHGPRCLPPVGAAGQDDAAGALVVDRRRRRRRAAAMPFSAERLGAGDHLAARADDQRVRGAEVLAAAVHDRAHGLGHRHVLLADAADAGEALPVAAAPRGRSGSRSRSSASGCSGRTSRCRWARYSRSAPAACGVPARRCRRGRADDAAAAREHVPLQRVVVVHRHVGDEARSLAQRAGRHHREAGEEHVADAVVVGVFLGDAVHAVGRRRSRCRRTLNLPERVFTS